MSPVLNKFPSPPISFLNKIQEGHVDAMKALKVLKTEEKVQRLKDTFICNTLHSIRVRIIVNKLINMKIITSLLFCRTKM